jgi:hypothetical protein
MAEENNDIPQLKGYVYRLNCNDGYFYIGSTINSLRKRLTEHKQCAKKFPERKLYKHLLSVGWHNIGLQCVEEVLYSFRDELYEKEDEYIKKELSNPFCLNINAALNTDEETKEKREQYREENRETINKKISEYRKTNDNHREYNRKYKEEHKEIRKNYPETAKNYYQKHKEQISENHKKWIEQNREHCQEYSKQYYAEHKDSDEFKEKRKKQTKKYYEENYNTVQARNKKYQEENKEKIAQQKKEKNIYKDCEQIQCECGGKYVTYHKKRHMESKKHLKFQAGLN